MLHDLHPARICKVFLHIPEGSILLHVVQSPIPHIYQKENTIVAESLPACVTFAS